MRITGNMFSTSQERILPEIFKTGISPWSVLPCSEKRFTRRVSPWAIAFFWRAWIEISFCVPPIMGLFSLNGNLSHAIAIGRKTLSFCFHPSFKGLRVSPLQKAPFYRLFIFERCLIREEKRYASDAPFEGYRPVSLGKISFPKTRRVLFLKARVPWSEFQRKALPQKTRNPHQAVLIHSAASLPGTRMKDYSGDSPQISPSLPRETKTLPNSRFLFFRVRPWRSELPSLLSSHLEID